MKKLSQERVDAIKKFCQTHPKIDAARVFGVSKQTVINLTKGIGWKKRKGVKYDNQENNRLI